MDTMVRVPKPSHITTLTLTQVAVTGGNSVYSYSVCVGPLPTKGMTLVITGFDTVGNNVTAVVTATATGTFTVATTTQVNETHAGSATGSIYWLTLSASTASTLHTPGENTLVLFSSDQPYEVAFGDSTLDPATATYFYMPAGLAPDSFNLTKTVTSFAVFAPTGGSTVNFYYLQLGKR